MPKWISLEEDYEIRDWTESLGADEATLRGAVQAVGDVADEVRKYLKISSTGCDVGSVAVGPDRGLTSIITDDAESAVAPVLTGLELESGE
ncbi:MAG: DUF3606 domain-containing protein [Sphingomonas sp.]|nr:DUF3606 domain-containing protein [Sphingomonas sp.]